MKLNLKSLALCAAMLSFGFANNGYDLSSPDRFNELYQLGKSHSYNCIVLKEIETKGDRVFAHVDLQNWNNGRLILQNRNIGNPRLIVGNLKYKNKKYQAWLEYDRYLNTGSISLYGEDNSSAQGINIQKVLNKSGLKIEDLVYVLKTSSEKVQDIAQHKYSYIIHNH